MLNRIRFDTLFNQYKNSWKLSWGAILFFLCSWATAYFLARQNFLVNSVSVDSHLIPQDAVFVASITTDTQKWQQLQKLGSAKNKIVLSQLFTQLQNSVLNNNSYSYQTHIQPWIGREITIAYLGTKTNSSLRQESLAKAPLLKHSLVIFLPIQNWVAASKFWQNKDTQTQSQTIVGNSRNYRNIKIREIQPKDVSPEHIFQHYSVTLLGRFVVIANDSQAMERIIDTFQGDPSLETNPRYQQAFNKIDSSQSLVHFYLNVPEALEILAAYSSRFLYPEQIQKQKKQSLAGGIIQSLDKIRLQGILWHKPSKQAQNFASINNKLQLNSLQTMAQYLPQETNLILTGNNMEQLWQNFIKESQSNPLIPINPSIFPLLIQSTTNLDWEEDFLPWMTEEFSFALIPHIPQEENINSKWGGTLILIAKTSDRSHTKQVLAKLDQFMSKRYNFKLKSTELSGQSLVKLTAPQKYVQMTHGWLTEKLVFLTFGESTNNSLISKSPINIKSNKLLQQLELTEMYPNNGQIFLNIPSLIKSGNKGLLPFSPLKKRLVKLTPQQQILLNNISPIGLTTNTKNEEETSFEIVIHLPTN